MPTIKTCWNTDCEYNRNACYCDAYDIEIGADGTCMTFSEVDIYAETNDHTLDVSASEVDDLARDVYIDPKFENAYRADGNTVGAAVEALIAEVIASEYSNVDLGAVPERVADALSNMLASGLLD